MARPKTSKVVWLRRFSQTSFLLLFFYLFLQTVYKPINRTGGGVTFFFDINPLVALNTWLAANTVPRAMLLSLVTLAVTLLIGRWFCGWLCPFGTLHNLATSLRGGTVKSKIDAAGYTGWHKVKYYVLTAFLVSAFLGVNVIGWLDPFSFLYRSLATSVFPAINSGIVTLFTWFYDVDPGVGAVRATAVTEPIYEFLRKYLLEVKQPHFYGGVLIGLLFVLVIALNFFRARFWCRYICPLGALLGITGKNPLVRLKKNEEACNNCRLCLADCQGGATPEKTNGWKPAECFYCWNCKSDCPADAITFTIEPAPPPRVREKA